MKRLLTIALWLLCMAASAQGTWGVVYRPADELKGQDAKPVYIYDVPNIGSLVVWDWTNPNFRLITSNGIFRGRYSQGSKFYPVVVGFYNDNGQLEKKFVLHLLEEVNCGGKFIATADFYIGGRANVKKMMSRMKSGNGYVRIVADLYDRPSFDIKVTPFERQ